jgi:hypothetical protein
MKQLLKEIIKMTPLFTPLRNWAIANSQKKELIEWERKGRPVPPPHIFKQRTIKAFAEKFGLEILVETGTCYGDMVEAMKGNFRQIYSIELSKELYEAAKKRFERDTAVEIIHGDSGIVLENLVERIDKPALFWLDGHYSAGETAKGDKDTPIFEELNHILKRQHSKDVVIIDDARCFGNDPAYPSIEDLGNFIKSQKPDVNISVEYDSIRIAPHSING